MHLGVSRAWWPAVVCLLERWVGPRFGEAAEVRWRSVLWGGNFHRDGALWAIRMRGEAGRRRAEEGRSSAGSVWPGEGVWEWDGGEAKAVLGCRSGEVERVNAAADGRRCKGRRGGWCERREEVRATGRGR